MPHSAARATWAADQGVIIKILPEVDAALAARRASWAQSNTAQVDGTCEVQALVVAQRKKAIKQAVVARAARNASEALKVKGARKGVHDRQSQAWIDSDICMRSQP